MPGIGIIRRPSQKAPVESEKPETHDTLLRLDSARNDKLLHLCRIGDTNRNDILRQLIDHAYEIEMAAIREGVA